jgi:hypothetical protein
MGYLAALRLHCVGQRLCGLDQTGPERARNWLTQVNARLYSQSVKECGSQARQHGRHSD